MELNSEWQSWICQNVFRRCKPVDMLASMVQAQWPEDQAIDALESMGLPLRVPRPMIQEHLILAKKNIPGLYLLDEVLTSEQCQQLIDLAKHKGFNRSMVVNESSGEDTLHLHRTSSGTSLLHDETPFINEIEARLAALTQWPVSHGEHLQVLYYEPGQEYKAHVDWFDPNLPGSTRHLQKGGQRVATMVIYLQVCEKGGSTSFPMLDLTMRPRQGGAIFFHNVDKVGRHTPLTLHAGDPVIEGVKIVMTYWQREQAFHGEKETTCQL